MGGWESFPRKPFSPPPGRPIHSIALLKVENPPVYDAKDIDSAGAVAAAALRLAVGSSGKSKADAETQNKRRREFDSILRSRNFDFASLMTAKLQEELTRAGYAVTIVEVPRLDLQKKQLWKDCRCIPADTDADAWLDVTGFFVGYERFESPLGNRYAPKIEVHARLSDPASGTVLYADRLVFCSESHDHCVYLPSERKKIYRDFTELIADNQLVPDEMTDGANALAAQIARSLHP